MADEMWNVLSVTEGRVLKRADPHPAIQFINLVTRTTKITYALKCVGHLCCFTAKQFDSDTLSQTGKKNTVFMFAQLNSNMVTVKVMLIKDQ